MKNKKNIEHIFQDKLKDFEANVPIESWEIIAEKLHKKKEKKRIIPLFWWKSAALVSSAAALLVLGIFLFKDNNKTPNIPATNIIANTGKTKNENIKSNPKINKKKNSTSNIITPDFIAKKTLNPEENAPEIANEIIPQNNNSENHKIFKKNKEKDLNSAKREKNLLAEKTEKTTIQNTESLVKNPIETGNNIANNSKIEEKESISSTNTLPKEEFLEKKIVSEIKKAKKENRFSISTFAAPIFAFSNGGSAIDQKLDNNSNIFNKNVSIGINTDYAITEKIKLRSGVHFINLSNETQNVSFFNSSVYTMENQNSFKNLTTNKSLGDIIIVNNLQKSNDLAAVFGASNIKSGEIRQELSFIEVPLEVSIPLYSKNLKISTISGFSTYFLDKNKVFLVSEKENIEIGKANNINSVHYSGNLGLHFQYGIKDKYHLILEPIFKYQINTYESGTTDSKPYFIGIYTGFSYKF